MFMDKTPTESFVFPIVRLLFLLLLFHIHIDYLIILKFSLFEVKGAVKCIYTLPVKGIFDAFVLYYKKN